MTFADLAHELKGRGVSVTLHLDTDRKTVVVTLFHLASRADPRYHTAHYHLLETKAVEQASYQALVNALMDILELDDNALLVYGWHQWYTKNLQWALDLGVCPVQ